MIMKISISFATLVPILLLFFSLAPTIGLGFNQENFTGVLCSPTERDALLKLKHDLADPSNRLASWVGDGDCCRWLGIVCHNVAGHVMELNLRSLSFEEYFDAFPEATSDDYRDYMTSFFLSGKINPSLLNLKHLMHLDLSNNDFGGIQIPKFLGSLGSLKYLNLSGAGFGGMVPHQLGNLSNLHYLNLGTDSYYYESYVENLDWVSGLSSLEFLDLSSVNLSKAFDWLEVINNALPSLVQLHLSNCQLSPILPFVNINFSSLSILDLSANYPYSNKSLIRTLSHLKTLVSLNLRSNSFEGLIPNDLQNLTSLRELDLSDNSFNESSIRTLSHLTTLVSLNLGWNSFEGPIPNDLQNLTSLRELDLSYNSFNESSIRTLSHLKSLVSLNLRSNSFEGPIPNDLQNLTSLRELDLSDNQFNSSIPNWLYGFSRLELLNLGSNSLQGEVSSAIRNMTSLISLDLSFNPKLEFNRGIPASFKDLCNLKVLSLSDLKLNQDIAEVFEILLGCVSDKIESLDLGGCQLFGGLTSHVGQFKNLASLYLSDNQLNGTLPDCFGGLEKLNDLDLSFNLISGPLPTSFGELASLRSLRVTDNRFNGTLPASFNALTKLEDVDISGNLLVGDVFEFHLTNLTKLRYFDAGGNQLILRVNPIYWIPPLQLEFIDLRSWNIGPQFPTWLRSLKRLSDLDLSDSSISSTVPAWFWNFSSQLSFLNLSHNQIHGVIPNNLKLNFSHPYTMMDLSSNNFTGPLPSIFSDVYSLDLSNNSFSGSIINFLCHKIRKNMKNMGSLDLNENLLSGKIPDCWMSWQYLEVIILSNNRFSGNIPKSLGTLSSLESLHLRSNRLSGELPESLKNCTKLVTLDVGENELTGNIPTWMGERLSSMMVLNMRANKFHGHIPKELCNLAALIILDLAHNSLSGSIPPCVYNFSAMAARDYYYSVYIRPTATRDYYYGYIYVGVNGSRLVLKPYLENQFLVIKGRMDEYSSILGLVRSIDFSNNNLSGEVPTEMTRLGELVSLNLSQNFLTGKIPKDIGVMRSLQCIDFSLNQLSGQIPPSMSSLTFLNHLNLSYNELWGEIPLGTQLQSFSPSSFMGNELCGLPLSKNCSGDGTTHDVKNGRNEDDSGTEINWFYVSMAVGFIVGFWSIVGPLLFNRRCRYVYFHFMDRLWDKIWWHFHVNH